MKRRPKHQNVVFNTAGGPWTELCQKSCYRTIPKYVLFWWRDLLSCLDQHVLISSGRATSNEYFWHVEYDNAVIQYTVRKCIVRGNCFVPAWTCISPKVKEGNLMVQKSGRRKDTKQHELSPSDCLHMFLDPNVVALFVAAGCISLSRWNALYKCIK